MAELVENVPARPRVSWGAVFAGAVAAVGLWMLLYAFGLAIGASTLNVQNAGSAKATGIFTGVWGVVAPLIALFVGGFVAGHGAGVWGRGDGALHGLVTWGLATIGGVWLLAGLVSSIAGGVASLGRGAAHAAGAAGGETGQVEQAMRSAGLNAEDAVRPLNQRLRAEGHPTVSPDQLEAAARDALQRSVREGRFDRGVLVTSLSQNTSLSRSDAEDLAAQVSTQVEGARSQLASGLQSATNAAGKALWGAFVALALGLIASIAGGLVGAPGTKRRHRREPAPAPIPTARPVGPPREVYP
jgi:hypothetical protein